MVSYPYDTAVFILGTIWKYGKLEHLLYPFHPPPVVKVVFLAYLHACPWSLLRKISLNVATGDSFFREYWLRIIQYTICTVSARGWDLAKRGWDLAKRGWDLTKLWMRSSQVVRASGCLAYCSINKWLNAKVATVLGSISASSDTGDSVWAYTPKTINYSSSSLLHILPNSSSPHTNPRKTKKVSLSVSLRELLGVIYGSCKIVLAGGGAWS